MKHGRGKMEFIDGCTLEGKWRNDVPVFGVLRSKDGTQFEGEFKD